MVSYTCNNCGYTADNPVEAKFCQSCGAPIAQAVAAPAPQMASVSAGSKVVCGPVIKEHLLAQLLEGGDKKSGRFEVRRDGVIYVTSSRWGNRVIQATWDDIDGVGLGMKDSILAIHLKNGSEMLVKMGGAHKWVTLIQSLKH